MELANTSLAAEMFTANAFILRSDTDIIKQVERENEHVEATYYIPNFMLT